MLCLKGHAHHEDVNAWLQICLSAFKVYLAREFVFSCQAHLSKSAGVVALLSAKPVLIRKVQASDNTSCGREIATPWLRAGEVRELRNL